VIVSSNKVFAVDHEPKLARPDVPTE
jgi:hypothetical protein